MRAEHQTSPRHKNPTRHHAETSKRFANQRIKHGTGCRVEPVFKERREWHSEKENDEERQSRENSGNDNRRASSARTLRKVGSKGADERQQQQPGRVYGECVGLPVMASQKKESGFSPNRSSKGSKIMDTIIVTKLGSQRRLTRGVMMFSFCRAIWICRRNWFQSVTCARVR